MARTTILNAIYTLGIQVLALVTLEPTTYGAFSIAYLMMALAFSVSLSAISEAWSRALVQRRLDSDWKTYYSAAIYLASFFGVMVATVCLLIPLLREVTGPVLVAVFFAAARAPLRYRAVYERQKRQLLMSDGAALLALAMGAALLIWVGAPPLIVVTCAWALGSAAAFTFSHHSVLVSPLEVGRWFRDRQAEIRPLLRDSLLLDAGAIGTPYLIAPMLGLRDFGIYRAVSSVAAPIRILISPIRPMLAAPPHRRLLGMRFLLIVTCISVIAGFGAWIGLGIIHSLDLSLGALNYLLPFAFPTAVFVAANTLGTFYMIVSRIVLDPRRLLAGRLIHTIVAILVPLAGVLSFGLVGAIWGYAIATVIWAIVWVLLSAFQRGLYEYDE